MFRPVALQCYYASASGRALEPGRIAIVFSVSYGKYQAKVLSSTFADSALVECMVSRVTALLKPWKDEPSLGFTILAPAPFAGRLGCSAAEHYIDCPTMATTSDS
jgi:hypothetical protein